MHRLYVHTHLLSNGPLLIYCQGLDVLDVECVIQYSVCRDITNLVQRGGRAGQATSTPALLLILYEPWVITADLSLFTQDLDDPDQPLQPITKTSKKPEQTGVAMYRLIHSAGCMRLFFANYFRDSTPNVTAVSTSNCEVTELRVLDFVAETLPSQCGSE
jgi:superfamily II DNA helicase RecQ